VTRAAASLQRRPALVACVPAVAPHANVITPASFADEVSRDVERLVRARVACDDVELHFAGRSGVRPDPSGQVSGAHLIAAKRGAPHEVCVPFTVDGSAFGELVVRRRRASSRFSVHEVTALEEIADARSFMVAHAIAYIELDHRRLQQAAAFREEREALVETLSAEIAHEVRYPINFFRSIFQRASEDRILEREDLEIGSEEVERLERLVSGLRRMVMHVDRGVADVAELASRTEALLRDRMSGTRFTVDIRGRAALRCDVDKITQVLVNLLANALDATEERGEVGIEWRLTAQGGELLVWDTGSGFTGDASRLFAPWYTTKPRGTGLGLAIAYRMVRAHGWMIEGSRREGRTSFVIAIPLGDVLLGPARSRDSGEDVVSSVVPMPRREGAA
jgi:two-component system sensor histidine kinase HydH